MRLIVARIEGSAENCGQDRLVGLIGIKVSAGPRLQPLEDEVTKVVARLELVAMLKSNFLAGFLYKGMHRPMLAGGLHVGPCELMRTVTPGEGRATS